MKKLLQYLFKRPIRWMVHRFSAAPKKHVVFASLTNLYAAAIDDADNRVKLISTDLEAAKFIIFSDQHKGDKSAADDFKKCEHNYIAALEFYNENQFNFIDLGDSEELWKFRPEKILPANKKALEAEAAFHPQRFYKTFGNHDLIWKNKPDVFLLLRKYFTMPLPVYEGIVIHLKTGENILKIFLTHGHQGDAMSDNNSFSTWIVAHVWLPLQRYLKVKVNTPSKDFSLRNEHNIMMSEWSALQQNCILITGHTHVPVFASGRYFNHPSNNIPGKDQQLIKPSYFNTGCCCFDDGDITGIEIADGFIKLIKWHKTHGKSKKIVLEQINVNDLMMSLQI